MTAIGAGMAEALLLVLDHVKLRRPGVRIEDGRRNPVTFFQLKETAELESLCDTEREGQPSGTSDGPRRP